MGYPHFAGAVEAATSTGGQYMPPVMGAAAFLMAEITGTPYVEIIKIAAIPAILYFLSTGVIIYLEAVKRGLKGMPASDLPKFKELLKDSSLLPIPILVAPVFRMAHLLLPFLQSAGTSSSVSSGEPGSDQEDLVHWSRITAHQSVRQ
jgi:TRAP-type uncharacterized transport system fused permease subunit